MRLSRLAFFDGSQIPGQDAPDRVPPQAVTLLAFGRNAFTKRGERGDFEFTEDDADNIIADFATRGRDLVIDYEHQTLSGSKAPAAGWISSLEKSAAGLVARIKYWTEEAKGLLSNGEYRYFSPVLHFSRSGRSVSAIHSVALTNHPALHQVPALVADDAAEAASPEGLASCTLNDENKEEVQMDELLKSLGLLALADASGQEKADAIVCEVDALLKLKSQLGSFLKLNDCASLEELASRFHDMVPAAEKETLEAALRKRDAETAVSKAFSDGKLAEKSRAWAVAFAERDIAAFNDWAEAAPRIVPDNDVDVAPRGRSASELADSAELKVYRTLGLSDEQINALSLKS